MTRPAASARSAGLGSPGRKHLEGERARQHARQLKDPVGFSCANAVHEEDEEDVVVEAVEPVVPLPEDVAVPLLLAAAEVSPPPRWRK